MANVSFCYTYTKGMWGSFSGLTKWKGKGLNNTFDQVNYSLMQYINFFLSVDYYYKCSTLIIYIFTINIYNIYINVYRLDFKLGSG